MGLRLWRIGGDLAKIKETQFLTTVFAKLFTKSDSYLSLKVPWILDDFHDLIKKLEGAQRAISFNRDYVSLWRFA